MGDKPEWVVPGAKVAVVSWHSHGGNTRLDVIDRVLARDVVLASGRRFAASKYNPEKFSELGGGSTWHNAPDLYPADHPQVLKIQEQENRDRAESKAISAYDHWRRDRNLTNAGELIRAIEAWVALQPQEVSS